MRLRHVYYRGCEYSCRDYLGHAVKEVGDNPVEHLNEERKLLQYPAMYVIRETGGIGGVDTQGEAFSSFWKMFGG